MNDYQIKERKRELQRNRKAIMQEWQEYDEQHRVIHGAYRPPDYNERQKEFHRRQSGIGKAIQDLPLTKLEKLLVFAIWAGIIIFMVIAMWYFLF